MGDQHYDLVVVGAGSGGLTAAAFAARLRARVALVEKSRIGGDCTWTGCVPSKALLKAAKVARGVSDSSRFGLSSTMAPVDMRRVGDYVRSAIQRVYSFETPETLAKDGIDVVMGPARFVDSHTIGAGDRPLRARNVLIATGARPASPPITGLDSVPYLTYETIFDNDRLPARLIVIGGGPIGAEIAQAYRRLGSEVTIVAKVLLPKEDPDARKCLETVFAREGIRLARARATAVEQTVGEIVVTAGNEAIRGDMLLVAAGRTPNVDGLDLEKAGVHFSPKGIAVDGRLRTNIKHIYAAGDVVGGPQFTHFAGWQAFQAARNALLPGTSAGFTDVVPRVTFTDPEVAHVGMTEEEARAKLGGGIVARTWEMSRTDRAICEGDEDGFIKLVTKRDGTIVGATVVAARAGETITEFILAIRHKWRVDQLAGAIHAYPTYSTAVQQLTAGMAVEHLLNGTLGRLLRRISKTTWSRQVSGL
jgi:pyruvate/2-oxoglutarate dehydrogenase complex dihydrolipoamide dehydrogenase (E3) component